MFAKKTFFLLTCVGSVFFVSQGEAEGLIAADHGIGPPARTSLLEAFSHEYYSPRKRKFSSELAASDPVAQSEGPGESFRNPPIHLLPAPTAGVPPARGPAAAAATAVAPDRAAKAESHLLHEVLPERPSARGPEGAGDDVKKMKKTSEEAPLKVLAIRDGMNMKGFLPCPATASFVSREFGQRQGDPRGVSDLSILRHLGGRDENTGRRDVDDNKNYYKVDAVRSDRVIYPLCDRSSVADDVSEDDVERPLVKADLGGGDLYGGLARSLQSLGNHQNQRRLRKNQESRDDAEKNIVDGRLLNASSSTSSIENIIKFNNDNISYLDVVSVGGSGVALEKLGLEKLTAEALLRFIKKEKYEAVVAASKGVKPLLEVMRLAAREPQEREFFPGVILVNQGEMDPNAAGAAEIVKLSSHLNTRVVLTGQPRSTANGGGGTEEDMGWLRARWEQQPISIDDQPVDEAKLGEFFGTKREEQKAGTAAAAAAENSHEEKAGFGVFLYLARDRSPGVSVPDTHGLPISLVAPAGGYQVSSLQGEIVGPNRAATSKDPYIFEMLRWVRKSSFASSKGGDQMEDGDAEDEGPGGPSSDGWLTAMVRDVHHCHTLYLGKRTLRASPRRELRFTKLQTSPLQRNLLEQLEEKNGVFEKVAPGPVQEEEEELVGPPGSADLAARRGEEMNAGRRLAPVSSQQLKWLSRMVGDTDPQEGNLVVLTAAKIVPPPRLLRTYEKRREQIRAQNERQKNGWLSETGAEGLPGGNLQKARDAGLLDEPGPQHGGGGGGVSRRHPRTFDKALSEFFEKNPFEELAAIDGLKSDWRNPDPAQRDWEREEYFLHGAGPEAAKGICQSGFLTFAGGKIQSPSVYFTEDATVAFTYAGGPPAPPSAGGAAPGPREEERDQSRQAEKRLWEWMLEETGLGKREILFPGVPVHFILVGRLLRGNVRDLPVDPRRGVPLHPASVAEKACVLRGETTKFRHHQEFSSGEENVSCARRGEAEILMTDNNDNPEDNEANVHGPFFHSVEYMGQPIGLPRTAREVVLVGDGDDTVNREAVRGGDNSKTRKDSTSSAVLDHLQAPDYPNNDHTRIQNLAALAKFARGPKEQMLSGAKGALAFAREQQVVPSYLVAVVNRHVDAGKPGTVVFVKPGGNVWYDPGLAKWQCHYVQLLRRSTPATSSSNSSAAVSSAGGFANIHSLGDQWASWWVQPLYRVAEGKQRWRTSTGQNMIKERRTGLERERYYYCQLHDHYYQP